MDDLKHPQLEAELGSTAVHSTPNGSLGAPDSIAVSSKFPKSYPSLNPIDVYREHIAEHLASITGVEAPEVYTKLQWTQTQDKGDLMLPVPSLRIKGKKPNELATEWAGKAGVSAFLSLHNC